MVAVGLHGVTGHCDMQRESGQNGYVNSYRILKTKERKRRERNGRKPPNQGASPPGPPDDGGGKAEVRSFSF